MKTFKIKVGIDTARISTTIKARNMADLFDTIEARFGECEVLSIKNL